MKIKKSISLVLIGVLAVSLLAGCGKKEAKKEEGGIQKQITTDESWNKVKEAGVLKIGLCPEYPPFESVNNKGIIEGFDASLAAAIGEELGVTVEFMNTPWEGLIAGLGSKEFDIVMSAMSPEEATSATDAVSISDAYYELQDVIVIGKDSNGITKKEDLAGKNVGFQTGSSAEQAVEGLRGMKIEIAKTSPYNRNADAFADLENGRIDAIIVSYPYAVTMSKEKENFKVIHDALQSCALAAILEKDARELTLKYNEALKSVKDSGQYKEIEEKWLVIE